jgi:hypothetical protein
VIALNLDLNKLHLKALFTYILTSSLSIKSAFFRVGRALTPDNLSDQHGFRLPLAPVSNDLDYNTCYSVTGFLSSGPQLVISSHELQLRCISNCGYLLPNIREKEDLTNHLTTSHFKNLSMQRSEAQSLGAVSKLYTSLLVYNDTNLPIPPTLHRII